MKIHCVIIALTFRLVYNRPNRPRRKKIIFRPVCVRRRRGSIFFFRVLFPTKIWKIAFCFYLLLRTHISIFLRKTQIFYYSKSKMIIIALCGCMCVCAQVVVSLFSQKSFSSPFTFRVLFYVEADKTHNKTEMERNEWMRKEERMSSGLHIYSIRNLITTFKFSCFWLEIKWQKKCNSRDAQRQRVTRKKGMTKMWQYLHSHRKCRSLAGCEWVRREVGPVYVKERMKIRGAKLTKTLGNWIVVCVSALRFQLFLINLIETIKMDFFTTLYISAFGMLFSRKFWIIFPLFYTQISWRNENFLRSRFSIG